MTDHGARNNKPSSGERGSAAFPWNLALLGGLIPAVFIFVLLLSAARLDLKERVRERALLSLEATRTALANTWDRSENLTVHVGRQLNGAKLARVEEILSSYKNFLPGSVFCVYNLDGERIPFTGADPAEDIAPLPHTARNLVQKALIGQPNRGFTRMRGFLALTVAVPVHASEAAVLVMGLPLDSLSLKALKESSQADTAVLPYMDVTQAELVSPAEGASTFSRSEGRYASVLSALDVLLARNRLEGPTTFDFGFDNIRAAAAPLVGHDGKNVGVLISAPLEPLPGASLLIPFIGAVLAGVSGFAVTGWALRRARRRLTGGLAEALNTIANSGKLAGWPDGELPAALSAPLHTLAALLKKGRNDPVKEPQAPPVDAPSPDGPEPAFSLLGNRSFLRLFENVPAGVFYTNLEGRFMLINGSFATLLGYESPHHLLAACPDFSDLCLYAEGIRNPLWALAEEHKTHSLSLRRKDGVVGHYRLTTSVVLSENGESSGIIEGFLSSQDAEESMALALRERDVAQQEYSSLALLLAATCKQVRRSVEPLSMGTAAIIGSDILLSMLNDIGRIARVEAESTEPLQLPLDVANFLGKLGEKVTWSFQPLGIGLRIDLSDEIPHRLSAQISHLRHFLERSLLAVTAGVKGGWAVVSLMRDPNAPSVLGQARVIVSVSWSPVASEPGHNAADPAGAARGAVIPGAFSTLFTLPSNAEPSVSPRARSADALDMLEEQEIIRYLAGKLNGDLVEGVFTAESRSISLVVSLLALAGQQDGEHSQAGRETFSGPEADFDPSAAGGPEEPAGLAPRLERPFTPSPMDILVMDDHAQEPAFPQLRTAAPDKGLDILLVDDNLNNRLLFSLFLKDTNHRITEAHDGQQGVEAFQHGNFDVVFLDMEMPLMDGYQATRIIRALEADAGKEATPIVAMTTYSLPEFRRQCLLAGCTDFLSKPFSKNALLSMLGAFEQLKEGVPAREAV